MRLSDRKQLIADLTAVEGRWPGTDAERRAANLLASRLRAVGRDVEVQNTYVRPEYSLAIALYCAVAIAASLLAIASAPLGLALAGVALFAMFGDLTTLFRAGRLPFFRRASQNLLSRPATPGAGGTVVLVAHYDAARTGWVFSPARARTAARLHERFRIGPFTPIAWSCLLLVATLAARAAGIEAVWLSVIQLVPTIVLLVSTVLLVDIALSGVVPGANDNASGVATAISVAEELGSGALEHLDVCILLTGAEESLMEGMRAFMAANHAGFDAERTWFVNLDSLGVGSIRYAVDEGFVVPFRYDARLISLCDAIAEADTEGRFGARPARLRFGTDALPARLRGFPAISITSSLADGYIPGYHTHADMPENIDDEALERGHAFVVELVRLLDREAGR